MAIGVAFLSLVVVVRRAEGGRLAESYQEVAARGNAWPLRRFVSAGASLSALVGGAALFIGVLAALWKTAPSVIIAVGCVYGLMIVVAMTAGRHRTITPARSRWERFVDLCRTVALTSP
jgi:hypothetical protein